MLRIYLDNCCYNRPYDDQSSMRISLETQAKLYIQELIKDGKLELVTSYILDAENGMNKFLHKRESIQLFMSEYESYYVSKENDEEIGKIAKQIMDTGVKEKDAYHIACALFSECDYFISTDDRLLKYQSDKIHLVKPEEFVVGMEV